METEEISVWDYLEIPHDNDETQALYSWGLNCDRSGNPFLVFLDLIGWSVDNFGEPFMDKATTLGYMELDYLADALKEYADNPERVRAWVDGLMNTEGV
jgi:hypothetical protein